MKTDIHPEYFADVEVTCSCGHNFKVGSTVKKIEVEVCSKCHPFYTGTQKLVDTAGRVDAFKKRFEKAGKKAKPKNEKASKGKKRSSDSSVSLNKAR